jgi:hypothetical protein
MLKLFKHIDMKQSEEDKTPKGAGTDFTKLQSGTDKAKNESMKSQRSAKGKSGQRIKKENVTVKTDVNSKKTGGGKQVSHGT